MDTLLNLHYLHTKTNFFKDFIINVLIVSTLILLNFFLQPSTIIFVDCLALTLDIEIKLFEQSSILILIGSAACGIIIIIPRLRNGWMHK